MCANEPIRIVLCDDHQVFVEGLASLLADIAQVRCVGVANNGHTALELLKHVHADMLLLDLNLPDMDGTEVLEQVRRTRPHLRILILTMNDEAPLIRRCMDAGASGYLLKTCSRDELVQAILAVHRGEPFYSVQVTGSLLKESHPRAHPMLASLTDRELQVLSELAMGHSNKEIAHKLFISPRTVDTHRTNIMRKLDMHNLAGLVRLALTTGLIS